MPEEEKLVPKGSDGPAAREWDRSSAGEPPGERTTSLSQVSPLDPGSLMRVFGGLHRRAQQSLLDMLHPGEEPRVVVPGAAGSGIVATDTRAIILKAGARFGAPFGERSKAFEYESVIGVRLDTEGSRGVIAVDAPVKIASCRVYWADSRDNAWKARNAIPVERPYEPARSAVDAIRGLLESYRDRHPAPASGRMAPAPVPRPVKALPETEPAAEQDDERGVVSPLPVLGERCPHCRAEVRPGWRFCPKCGAESKSATPTPLG